jgi:hypothetical protein
MIGVIDPFWATLAGTLVGGFIVVAGQLVSGWAQSRREDARITRAQRAGDLVQLQDLGGEYVDLAGERLLWASNLPGPAGRTPADEVADRIRVIYRMRAVVARIGDEQLHDATRDLLDALGTEWEARKARDPDDETASVAQRAFHDRIGELLAPE